MKTKSEKISKQFLVALHVFKFDQAHQQADLVLQEGGAHGVILINHELKITSDRMNFPNLFDIAESIKEAHPTKLVGVNPLDLKNLTAIHRTPQTLDILWTDDGGIIESEGNVFLNPHIQEALKYLSPKYYGSELFKYPKQATKPELVTKIAASHFGALITSGKETGEPPSLEKIQQIRSWIGDNATLGIASGMSVENIDSFLPYVDIFIVATSFHPLENNAPNPWKYDFKKVRAFREKIDAYEKNNS